MKMKKMYTEVEDTLTAVGIVTGFYALMALVALIV
jgi:hypothetical protein